MNERSPAERVRCRLCGEAIEAVPLSLGRLPVCNDFNRGGSGSRFCDLDIVECERCQLIQLREPPPREVLMPRLPWIAYREPEAHIDALIGELLALRPGARSALGTGPFEQPLLSRLNARGLDTRSLPLVAASTDGRYPYLESWAANLNAPQLTAVTAQFVAFDIVSCRYIVEHAPAPVSALSSLKPLLSPNGVLVIEIPDSGKFLEARDYCFLWEEHNCYFVESTLEGAAQAAGFDLIAMLRYAGALEDALVAVLQVAKTAPSPFARQGASAAFTAYRGAFSPTRERLRATLNRLAGPSKDRLALFGIGHHAIMFVNAFGLSDDIALAVDDDPDKIGFFPPGFRVPVVGSKGLMENDRITTCLFAVAPAIQARVQAKLAPLTERGVQFKSIYAAPEDSIMKDLD